MKRKLLNLLLGLILTMTVGCASSYKPINPSNLNLQTKIEKEELSFSYQYDVLQRKGNKKYSKKEQRNNFKLIAVKIQNKTNKSISVSEDIGFYVNNQEVSLIDPIQITQNMSQSTASYLLYLLLTPLKLISANSDGSENVVSIGYGIGPGLSVLNMIKSSSANSAFKKELTANNIIGKLIPSGETLSGIIAIRDIGYEPISVKIKE